jgi:endo-1,4-beta-xylanase
MRIIALILSVLLTAACTAGEPTLKKAFEGKFILGAAVNQRQILGTDVPGDSVLFRHFGAIEPENCLKSAEIMPTFGQYNWELADKYVDFGEKNGLAVYGHCLIWHSQCTPDFCYDQDGQLISPELLKERMKQHITTVMTRYKGRIKGWDVVNEAILEDGSWRPSPFWQILGEEFIPWAFQCAHEADPDCELYYNDYSMHEPKKLDTVIELVKKMQARGIRIDAIGFQGHVGMDYPDLDLYESHLRRVKDETGLDVCITELDMSILPSVTQSADVSGINWFEAMRDPETREALLAKLDPYKDGIPEDVYAAWNARMGAFLEMFLKNSDVVRRINVWGVTDADSWKNGWPIPGRHDAPLWIDRNFELKPFLKTYVHE